MREPSSIPHYWIFLLALLTGLCHGTPQGKRDTTTSGSQVGSTNSSSSYLSSSTTSLSRLSTPPYPTGNSTASTNSATGAYFPSGLSTSSLTSSATSSTPISTFTLQSVPISTPPSSSSTSSFPTLSGPYRSHLSYHGSSGAHGSSDFPRATGTRELFPTSVRGSASGTTDGVSLSRGASVGSGSVQGIFPSGGNSAGSGPVRGIFPSSGFGGGSGTVRGVFPPGSARTGTGTGFPQLTGFSRGHGISASAFGTGSGISDGFGPSGSGASGSLGGFARNPACTASWNSRLSAANGTVITTTTYSYTLTVAAGTISTYRPGQVAVGPTTATFNAGTVTYEVGSDSQCCGDCNILYPDVRVYYWPTNNTNTWCLKGQTTIPPGPVATGGAQILDPGLPNLPTLHDSVSPTSTVQIGETTGALADYTGIPPGAFGAEKRATKLPDMGHPMITPAPKLVRTSSRSLFPVKPRRVVMLGGSDGLKVAPGRNETLPPLEPNLFGGGHSNFSLAHSNSSFNEGLHREVIDVVDGMTFVSPTVYVVISTISAKNKCGNVGDVFTSLTLSYAKDQLSTVDAFGVTSSFNFADLPCPPSSWAFPNPLQGNTAALQGLADSYHPRILVPHTALQDLDPKWQSCNIQDVGQGYDPPRQLTPQTVIASTTSAPDLPLCSGGGKADTNSLYAENTKSHCLDPLTLPHFPVKAPVFTAEGGGSGGDDEPLPPPANAEQIPPEQGPGFKTPNSNLAQVTPSVTAPVFQFNNGNANGFQPAPVSNPPAPNPTLQGNPPGQPPVQAQPNLPQKEGNTPAQKQAPPLIPSAVVVDSSGTPLTLSQGNPSIIVGSQPVGLVGSNIIAGSLTVAAPVQQPPPTDSTAPIVAGGMTFTPASTNPPAAPAPTPVQLGGLTFSAPHAEAQAPPNPQNAPAPIVPPVVAGGITYQPVAQGPSQTPVTVGGLTFNPVSPAPAIGAPGQTGAANIVVGGQTYAAGVTASPANAPVFQNGITIAPVPAGAAASTPLGVVGGQVISGGSSQAVVAGQTFSAGGPPVTVQGTPVSIGSANIVIGSSTAALPESMPTDAPAALGVVGGQVISGNSQSAVVAGQTLSAGGPPVTVQGTPVSLGGSNIVIGTSTAALPTSAIPSGDTTNVPLGIVGGQVISGDKSHAVVDGQTILPGSVATISGTPVSLGDSNIVIGTNSVPLPTDTPDGVQPAGPSAFAIGGSTVSRGGSPITVSGTRISYGPSGLVVGSSTVPLTDQARLSQVTGPPVYSFDGTGVTQGSPAITISGTRVSLGSSNVVIGSKTIALPSSSVFSVGGQVFTPQAGGFSIDGTTVTPGGPGVTVSGTAVSIDASSNLIFGSSTIALPLGATGNPTLTAAGETLTANPKSLGGGFVVDGQTLTPGAAPVTVSGTAVSLNTASSLIIGSSTIALASAGSDALYKNANSPLTAKGETFTPLGSSSVAIDGTTLSIAGPALTDHGTTISLASGGLVVDSSTFAYPTPASNALTSITNGPLPNQGATPTVFAIDGETFTAAPSSLLIAGTDVAVGGEPITLNGTVISLASDSLVVGASTIPLASVSGLTAAIASATPTAGPGSALLGPGGAAQTGKGGKTGGAVGRGGLVDLRRVGVGGVIGALGWVVCG